MSYVVPLMRQKTLSLLLQIKKTIQQFLLPKLNLKEPNHMYSEFCSGSIKLTFSLDRESKEILLCKSVNCVAKGSYEVSFV